MTSKLDLILKKYVSTEHKKKKKKTSANSKFKLLDDDVPWENVGTNQAQIIEEAWDNLNDDEKPTIVEEMQTSNQNRGTWVSQIEENNTSKYANKKIRDRDSDPSPPRKYEILYFLTIDCLVMNIFVGS